MLTSKEIRRIKRIIKDHMDLMVMITVGGTKAPPSLLKKLGIPKDFQDLISSSYKLGKLTAKREKKIVMMSNTEIEEALRKISLTPRQKLAVDYTKAKTEASILNLTTKLQTDVTNYIVQGQLDMYTAANEVLPDAIEERKTRNQIVQELHERTGTWSRDWDRVAHTEMWDAKMYGEADAIENSASNNGKETLVYKSPAPNACAKCKELYLEMDGKRPRIFKLSELRANGSNYGKKQSEWKPVLGVMHPNCMCTFNVMPDGYHFDDNGDLEMDDY